jgi:murein L,D-transpeptidase YcbB/YkuD
MRMLNALRMRKLFYPLACIFLLSLSSCKSKHKHITEKEIVSKPEELKLTVSEVIESALEQALDSNGHLSGFDLKEVLLTDSLYKQNSYASRWTSDGKWLPEADSLYKLIRSARSYGLYPDYYYKSALDTLYTKTVTDTSRENKLDASLWAKTDMYLTSAFISLTAHLKSGRLMADSTRRKDPAHSTVFYLRQFDSFRKKPVEAFTAALEPRHVQYADLKLALANFLETADLRHFTYVNFKDSINLRESIRKRLLEDSIRTLSADSLQFSLAIKEFQRRKGIKVDGKISESLVIALNDNDEHRFARIAVTLDRYKQMSRLPANYIWVNIPAYRLDVFENDTVVLTSKVVVGKPETSTPVITSVMTDMITYPLWHIPNSIIVKEILPALKKDPGYLKRKGYSLVDKDYNEIDPYTIEWSKYEKGIPYRIIQGSGDDNALGVLKFNFPNKFSVYLHDTNQRSFFSRKKRALSHGCVRVQAWQDLAYYLLDKDSTKANAIPPDSLSNWLALKEKHVLPLRSRVPLFIRYFTCEAGSDGSIVFHEDIYGEDRRLRQAYLKPQ